MDVREEGRSLEALVCSVGDVLCALPLIGVVETMRPLPVGELERTPSFVLGVSIIRGEPTAVVDVAALLGVNAPAPARFVVVGAGERHVALAVTAVLEVREIENDLLGRFPPLLVDAAPGAVSTLGRLDNDLLVVLSGAHLVPAEAWDAMDRKRVS